MTVDPNQLMSEDDLLDWVLDLAKRYQLLAYHPVPCRVGKSDRWVTSQAGDPGFPDLVIAGNKGVVFVELKSERGRLGLNQKVWINRLKVGGARVYVWRPSDRDEIHAVLKALR